MIRVLALWFALTTDPASVREVSVLPVDGRTEIIIEFDGAVSVKDFRIPNPERVVVDVTNARQTLPRTRFPDIRRGGIEALRVSQFQPGVVRLVFDLKKAVEYTIRNEGGVVRISFPNPEGTFTPWRARGALASTSTPNEASADDFALTTALPEESAGALAEPDTTRPAAPADTTRPPAASGVTQTPEPAAPLGEPSSISPVPVRPKRTEPPITVFFKATPINDVIATFAEFSGRSIVIGQGVSGTITADIRNQPWDVALSALLASYGLSAQEMESGIIRVDKVENLREQEKVEELITRPFTIKYASVDSLLPAVKGLLSPRGSATTSSATNTVVVTDGRSVVEGRIAPMIAQLDARTPQVEIAAKIIFINRTALDELGVSYDLQDQARPLSGLVPGAGTPVWLTGDAIAALGNAAADARVTGATFQFISSLVLGRYRLSTFIDALTSLSVAEIEARPIVRTLDHREAMVQVGEETPIRVLDPGGVGGARANVQLKNTGIILKVTPHVTGNQVLLDVHAERSGIRLLAEAELGMVFDKQASSVQVLVENGETAVISGLTIVEKNEAVIGIPILRSLPIVGAFFRKTLNQEIKKDLLIMVTPHIIRDGN